MTTNQKINVGLVLLTLLMVGLDQSWIAAIAFLGTLATFTFGTYLERKTQNNSEELKRDIQKLKDQFEAWKIEQGLRQ